MLEGMKLIGAGAAIIAIAGAAIGIGNVFSSLIQSVARNPSLASQDAATHMIQGIMDLHHDIFFLLILILVFASWMLVRALWHFHYQTNPIPQRIVHGTTIEILWTNLPVLILVFIAILSFALLFFLWKEGFSSNLICTAHCMDANPEQVLEFHREGATKAFRFLLKEMQPPISVPPGHSAPEIINLLSDEQPNSVAKMSQIVTFLADRDALNAAQPLSPLFIKAVEIITTWERGE